MSTPIPVIDVSALASDQAADRRAVASRIGAACRDIGFFAITGHGVPLELVQGTFTASQAFFAQPLADKQALAYASLSHNRGYVGTGVEALDEHRGADQKEAFNLIWTDEATRPPNAWPALPGWRERVQAYFDATLAAARRLHRAFALDLGLAEDFFDDKIDRPLATLRLLHYPGSAVAQAGQEDDGIGAGAHTDYGNVTLLATDGVSGLQVQGRGRDEWIAVPPLPGAFVCNIGDCLMRWTNDVYLSTPHRVLRPARERYSIALFLDPNPDALVSALPSCVPPGQAPRHAPITTQAYLQSRFDATYGSKAG
ncbi:isopenicillin N synthase family oxygenase [Xenophilus arseniciresistens]|uniref:2-oxoglutarate-dependent ethylene/succinate-forming enzyme n=1 Tax=Xenophilus arseniciresistens TaxID=1283306 RepID=A0AAE3NEX7_9BURK|nr:2-oxoglutarate and iron-dependent oxygenase domain-containing protein [Xenophilus arseniciresistens]MDA7419037.1 isopenicillin N synthase family oxygenase [Xenophilus arseniciresistens]